MGEKTSQEQPEYSFKRNIDEVFDQILAKAREESNERIGQMTESDRREINRLSVEAEKRIKESGRRTQEIIEDSESVAEILRRARAGEIDVDTARSMLDELDKKHRE